MVDEKRQSGGVNISGDRITVGGDVVGRDKTTIRHGVGARDLTELAEQFAQIKHRIAQRADDPDLDKREIKNLVENIEKEAKKGEAANPNKVGGWVLALPWPVCSFSRLAGPWLATAPIANAAARALASRKQRRPSKPVSQITL